MEDGDLLLDVGRGVRIICLPAHDLVGGAVFDVALGLLALLLHALAGEEEDLAAGALGGNVFGGDQVE